MLARPKWLCIRRDVAESEGRVRVGNWWQAIVALLVGLIHLLAKILDMTSMMKHNDLVVLAMLTRRNGAKA